MILASSSPWRREILRTVGIEVECVAHRVDEAAFDLGDDVRDGVRRLAEAKALSIDGGDRLVIAADQVLWHDGRVYGKAADADEARARLARFAGGTQELVCGWAIARAGRIVESGVAIATVTTRALDADAIDRYVATGEWEGSCGCSRYEGVGRQLVDRVDGDFHTVLGLPLEALLPALRRAGAPGLI